jgi:hypothetical protein
LQFAASLSNPKNHQIKEDKPDGSYVTRGRVAKRLRLGKLGGKNPLGRPWRRWEDNLREAEWAWTGLMWSGMETSGGHL